MAKEVAGLIKLQIKGGAANPSPPVGPALGSKGINIMSFCKEFNARTQDKAGKVLPVVITYYADKSFSFVIKTPPLACATFIAVFTLLLKNNSSTDIASGLYSSIIIDKSSYIFVSLNGNDSPAFVVTAPLSINLNLLPW